MSEVIVLLHGSASGSYSWGPIRSALVASGASAFAPDMLGYGKAPAPSDGYGIQEQVEHLKRQMVPGAAHMIPLTHPAAVIAAIQREVTS